MLGDRNESYDDVAAARPLLAAPNVAPDSLRKLLPLAFLASLASLACVVYLALANARSVAAAVGWSEHSHDVRLSAERARRLHLQLSNDARRVLLTAGAIPSDYASTVAGLRGELETLGRLVSDNRAQLSLLEQIRRDMERFLLAQEQLLASRPSVDRTATPLGELEALRVAAREKLIDFSEQEQRVQMVRDRVRAQRMGEVATITIAGSGLSLALFGALFLSLDRELRKRGLATRALRGSEQHLAATLESIGDAVITTDVNGRIQRMNRAALDLTGFRGNYCGVPQSEVLQLSDASEDLQATGVNDLASRTRHSHAAVLLSKNERRYDVEYVVTPIVDIDGEGCGTVAVLRDVTRERQLNEQFRRLLHAAPDAIVISDHEGRIRHANQAAGALFEYSAEELRSLHVEDLIPERFRGRHRDDRARYHATNAVRAMDAPGRAFFALTKTGREFRAAISLSPLRTAESAWAITAVRDISDQHARTEALRLAKNQVDATNRELEAFSYSVAHDLRAPLRQIVGFASALHEDYGAQMDEQAGQYLGLIRAAGERMGELIEDLLKLSRVTRAELELRPVDLAELAHRVLERLRQTAPERQVTLRCDDSLLVTGDARLLTLALENLLGNAWKFSRDRALSVIEVGAALRESERCYFVRDNGAGFDMRRVAKLFVPFQRLHKPAEFEGTGIGLATVQRVIHRHGGRVFAESTMGQGATFWFTLGTTHG